MLLMHSLAASHIRTHFKKVASLNWNLFLSGKKNKENTNSDTSGPLVVWTKCSCGKHHFDFRQTHNVLPIDMKRLPVHYFERILIFEHGIYINIVRNVHFKNSIFFMAPYDKNATILFGSGCGQIFFIWGCVCLWPHNENECFFLPVD